MESEQVAKDFVQAGSEIPSREKDEPWIYAFSSVDEDSIDFDKVGKWLLFFDNVKRSVETGLTDHDNVWQLIKKLTEDDILYRSKCSTSLKGICEAYDKNRNGVICCYTVDYTDKQDVKRAADAIRGAVHIPCNIFYKTDNDTRAGKYRHQGGKHVSIYKHTTENDMYERVKSKWNRVCI